MLMLWKPLPVLAGSKGGVRVLSYAPAVEAVKIEIHAASRLKKFFNIMEVFRG